MEPRVGDTVEVPGGMHGTVKFVGAVDGKKGTFAGVQLAAEYAARGKNSGEVDGKNYFRTTKPGSGIFLPLEKATRRASPTTPRPTSITTFNQGVRTPLASKPNFSQSIGPGARAASPASKLTGRRPSLPRPQSPMRQSILRPQSPVRPTPGKLTTPKTRPSIGLAKSTIGAGPQYRTSPTTRTPKFSASLRGPSATTPVKKQLSPLGPESSFDEEPETTPTPSPAAAAKTIDNTIQEEEMKRLKASLEEKDRQLRDQASSLTDMEKSLTELQSLLPADDAAPKHKRENSVPEDIAQMRAILREKNEKIQMISGEFDAHRADFRSTIDTLEMASTETERVYEQRVDELLQQVRDLQDRGEDVESVAQQFKQLEELVQELEEGLEHSRRGEAEARGEVEFLRGEVERSRSELRHEKERATSSGGNTLDEDDQRDLLRDLEQRDDEIRGLKAIIHSLNKEATKAGTANGINGHTNDYGHQIDNEQVSLLEHKVQDLEALVERKAYREEELETELERLRGATQNGHPHEKHKSASTVRSNRLSDRTVVPGSFTEQHNALSTRSLETMHEGDSHSTVTDGSALWCEICETGGHDILTCTNMFGGQDATASPNGRGSSESQRTGRDVVAEGLKNQISSPRQSHEIERPAPLSTRNGADRTPQATPGPRAPDPNDQGMVAGKTSGIVDQMKWCALCERDGHESVDCPFEDAF